LSSATDAAGFVDAYILSFCFLRELAPFRICFVSGPIVNPFFSVFSAPHSALNNSSKEALTEIIIRCDGSHFTLLKPLNSNETHIDNHNSNAFQVRVTSYSIDMRKYIIIITII